MKRRSCLGLLATLSLAGCGFELRRALELHFHNIALTGFAPHSLLEKELRRALAEAKIQVLEDPNRAEVVLEALEDAVEKGVVASTAAGQVREIQLRQRLVFRMRTRSERELIPPTEILLSRDMSYSETVALAKEQEEALLFRAMRSDIVAQLMRRLAAVQGV